MNLLFLQWHIIYIKNFAYMLHTNLHFLRNHTVQYGFYFFNGIINLHIFVKIQRLSALRTTFGKFLLVSFPFIPLQASRKTIVTNMHPFNIFSMLLWYIWTYLHIEFLKYVSVFCNIFSHLTCSEIIFHVNTHSFPFSFNHYSMYSFKYGCFVI